MPQQKSAAPLHEAVDLDAARARAASRRRGRRPGPACRRFSSPASASTARRLKATTTVPGRRLWNETAPVQSSGALRSKKRTSASGNAFCDQRQRLDGAEQEDVPVLAREQQARPGGSALGVVRPLHLVEHEHLAAQRRHLGGAADDRRVLVDALLAGHEADALLAELRGQAPVRLLREHPQRRREDAAPGLGQELERRVRLARVRRADVRDDRLRLERPGREDDLAARARATSASRRARRCARLGRFCRPRCSLRDAIDG